MYEKPDIMIVEFKTQDVIRTSLAIGDGTKLPTEGDGVINTNGWDWN